MLTQNDGKSIQSGCGWDVLETGCCFLLESSSYACFRCLDLLVGVEMLLAITYKSVSLSFRTGGVINQCGPDLSPKLSSNSNDADDSTVTSNMFLCNRVEWEQGDFIDDAGLMHNAGIGTDFGLKKGRHVQVNYNNYQQSQADTKVWITGPEVMGEGIFECFNLGSCIEPDTCSCRDGYGGFDCKIPLCK
eukprot:scaffold98033_cov23-Cyclotella_meneghiniana.AAC.3